MKKILGLIFFVLLIICKDVNAQACETAWDVAVTYNGGNLVSFDGNNYEACYNNIGVTPLTTMNCGGAQWKLLGACLFLLLNL